MTHRAGLEGAPSEEELARILEAGAAAPSGGNVQPWRALVTSAGAIEVSLDPERSDSFIDVGRAASVLAVGAFAENAALEAERLGIALDVELLGGEGLEAPLVRLSPAGRRAPSEDRRALAEAIGARASNRRPWDGQLLGAKDVRALVEAARSAGGGCDLHAVRDEPAKRAVIEAIAEGDVVRTFHRASHQQMLSEMRWTPEEVERTRDGIDLVTLELPPGALTGLRLMRSRLFVALFVTRERVRMIAREGLGASSHLGCVSMPAEPEARRLLTAGRAIERAWLRATALGLSLAPWSVLPLLALRAEVAPETLGAEHARRALAARSALEAALGVPEGARAIFVFRLSRAAPPSARALRRPPSAFTQRAR